MVYIQSNDKRTLPHHFDAACAMFGAEEHALEFRLTSFDEVANGKFDTLIRTNLFVGSTEFMREVFKRIGLTNVRLPHNANRVHEIITLAEANYRAKSGKRLFIKPIEVKLFTGFVMDGTHNTALNGLSAETPVMAYDVFAEPIQSEWRVYVHNRNMIDARNYSGDFTISPDYKYVQQIVHNYKSILPCAYTIDIAILNGSQNVVVEFNDMWAIGNYGIPNDLYFSLLRDRYFEIVKSNY